MKPDVQIHSLEPSVPMCHSLRECRSPGACSTTSLSPGEAAVLKELALGSSSSARSALWAHECYNFQSSKQRHSDGQMWTDGQAGGSAER